MHALLFSLPLEGEVMSWDSSPSHAKPTHPLWPCRPSGTILSFLYSPLFSMALKHPNYADFIHWWKCSKSGRQKSVPQAAALQRARALPTGSTLPSQGKGQQQASLPVELSYVSLWVVVMEHIVKWHVSMCLFLALYIHGYCDFLHDFYNSHTDILVPVFF